MKKLILIRHGTCDYNGDLTDFGKSQLQDIGTELSNTLTSVRMIILCSSAPRAEQSAKILSNCLHVPIELYADLWSDSNHEWDLQQAWDLITRREVESHADIVIVVTHLEYCNYLPQVAWESIRKEKKYFTRIDKGEKLIIDFETPTVIEEKEIEDPDELPF